MSQAGRWRAAALVGFLFAQGCATKPPASALADVVYFNGAIYTVDATRPWANAMAVRDGKIMTVGSDDQVNQVAGADAERVDLGGRMVMPGIHDMHIHPIEGGVKDVFECAFPSSSTLDEILSRVEECVAERPEGTWIVGGQWPTALLDSGDPPNRHMLDAITSHHPVWLMDWAVHNAWVNSAALDRLGIDRDTPDPAGGKIVRDQDTGAATGILLDNAAYEAQRQLPPYSPEQYARAAEYSVNALLSYGVTSFKDAITTPEYLNAYHALDADGRLGARAHACLSWKSAWSRSHEEELKALDRRDDVRSESLYPDCVKIMLDGIPVAYTSALLEPYESSSQFGDDHRGELMFSPADLAADVSQLDAQGLTIKIHATGDRSARVALDAFGAARRANDNAATMHELSHAQLIHPDDVPRFAELNVAAEMCPILWYPGPSDAARESAMGVDRARRLWPTKTLMQAGALVFYGSDWPAVVPNPSPWPGIEAMVSRRNPYGNYPGTHGPEQAISLDEALRVFTLNGAVASRVDELTGSLQPGKFADFIVLDRNLFQVPIDDVGDTRVLKTVVGGKPVFEREN